uniref:Uncharacterized protein n=1 Tax=Pleurozia purpurea TaxID=280637 RepID=D0R058_9MARC|nr:hypothetical protein PlpuMp59 [Pleurozia purpurea]ACR19395.1 hypothetical protein PlpuMp59 [Pleurozia purpurea]
MWEEVLRAKKVVSFGPCKAKEARSACKGKEVSGPCKSVSRLKVLTHLRTQRGLGFVGHDETTKQSDKPRGTWSCRTPQNRRTVRQNQGFDCVSGHANDNGSGTQNCRTIYIEKF